MDRLADDPTLEIERGGETLTFRAAKDPDNHARYHALRQAKYGWPTTSSPRPPVARTSATASRCGSTPAS